MSTFDISRGDTAFVDIGKGHYDIILPPGLYGTATPLVCNGGFSPNPCLIEDLMITQAPEIGTGALQQTNASNLFPNTLFFGGSGPGNDGTILSPALHESNSTQLLRCDGEFSLNNCPIENLTVSHVPEPMTGALLGFGLFLMLLVMRGMVRNKFVRKSTL